MDDFDAPDAAQAKWEADTKANIAAADKETLWWSLYKLLGAIHSARYAAETGAEKAILHVIGYTADHWGPQIPGMPTLAEVTKECRADDRHHELTYWAEARGLRITGDEFI